MSHHWMHAAHAASHSKGKLAAVVLIVIGLFFAPILIGIPILLIGIAKLFSDGRSH